MRTMIDHLRHYAAYHRDRRNIATHFIGIPMIVLAVTVLLSRPGLTIAGRQLSLACLIAGASVVFYLRLDRRYGLAMAAVMGLMVWMGNAIAAQSPALWLIWGIGLFVVGWIFQFVGHHYEGRKPAFLDDIAGLIIGPLFVLAEAGFLLGWRRDVQSAIAETPMTGPTG